MEINRQLLVFLSYAVGLVLLGILVIAKFPVYTTALFVAYIVAGIFLGKSFSYDMIFFLASALLALLIFFAGGSVVLVGVSLVSAYGFLMLASMSNLKLKKSEAKVQREKIKQIINEVVKGKPEVEVVSYKDDKPKTKKAKKSAKKK